MKTRLLMLAVACGALAVCQQAGAQYMQGYGSSGYPMMAMQQPGAYAPGPSMAGPAMAGPQAMPGPLMQGPGPVAADPAGCGAGCGENCDAGDCGIFGCCCDPCRTPKFTFFGDLLYMRPRDSAVGYAVVYNGPVVPPRDATPVQVSQPGIVDIDYELAYRIGGSVGLDDRSGIAVSYTRFKSDQSIDSISTNEFFLVRSMVIHPSTWNDASDGLDAAASYSMDMDLVDMDYRWTFACNSRYSIIVIAGARYAHLEQDFASAFATNGSETVVTNIGFEGGGLRVGLEAERRWGKTGLLVYGRGVANFVAGKLHAQYAQGTAFDASVVDTGWSDARLVSIYDLEIGIGWKTPGDHIRVTAGYMVSSWQNIVKTDKFIDAVQRNNFIDMGGMLNFDGLVARAELRF